MRSAAIESAVVANADIPKLASMPYRLQEIKTLEYKRRWLRDRMWSIRHGDYEGDTSRGDGLDRVYSELSAMDRDYADTCADCLKDVREIETILQGIESRDMRTFVNLRYVVNAPNRQIMEDLNIRRKTFEKLCRIIEDAPDMKSVKWPTRWLFVTRSRNAAAARHSVGLTTKKTV